MTEYCIGIAILILLPCWCVFLQENPSEEDAQIVEKILAMRRAKKKVVNQVGY